MTAAATPSQTVGPFFSFGLCTVARHQLVDPARPDAIRIGGRVLDGEGAAVPDAMIEIWQRDEHGGQPEGFGWGRCGTGADGEYGFVTVKPGGPGAPFVTALIFARGLLKPLLTRIYFPGEARNASDPLLGALTDEERTGLIGTAAGDREVRFDIHLQGDQQTTFLAL